MTEAGEQAQSGAGSGSSPAPLLEEDVIRYFMQAASLPLVAIDAHGLFLYRSRQADELFGLPDKDRPAFSVLSTLSERNAGMFKAHLEQVILERREARCEVELVVPDQGRRWVRFISHPGVRSDGSVICWSSVEDLTQVRRLEKTEALYQRAADIIGKSDSVRDFSRRMFDLLRILFGIDNGYVALYDRDQDLITFPFFLDTRDPYPEPRAPENGLTDYVLMSGRILWLAETREGGRDVVDGGYAILGTEPSDWIGAPINSRGRVAGMIAVQTYEPGGRFSAKDIGLIMGVVNLFEVFLSRINLERQQQLMSAAVEAADETIVVADIRGVIQYVNPAFERKSGYTRDQVIGRTMSLISSGKHDEDFYRDLWDTIRSGNTWRGRFINRRKDGSLYDEEAVISPIRSRDGEIVSYVGVKRDLSREVELERERLQTQKSEQIARLVEIIKHDFSNQLMTIRSSAETIRGRGPAEAREAADILGAVERAEEAIASLDGFAAIELPEPGMENLNQLLLDLKPAATRLVGERYELQFELAPRLEPAYLVRGQVEQAVTALLLRAAAAMPMGGVIGIRTLMAPVGKDEPLLFDAGRPDAASLFAVVEVADQGATSPREQWVHGLDDEQDRTSPASLANLGDIMRTHAGHVSVRANLPSGMVFRLYFPVREIHETAPAAKTATASPLPRGSETILLAEDDEGARRVIARMLEDQGYTVLQAESGAMAIRFLLGHQGNIHLLITDMMMPDFDGRALSEQSLSLKPDMKVIYVSGYSRSDLEAEGIGPDAKETPLLKKPFKRDELLQLVRHTLDAG